MTRFVVCRSADEELDVGALTGYKCASCGKEIQASPTGRVQIDEGGIPVCNPCGFKLAATYPGQVRGIEVNPAAQRTMSQSPEGREALDHLRHMAKAARRPECDVCGVKADSFWKWKSRAVCMVGLFAPSHARASRIESPAAAWLLCPECAPLWSARDSAALGARAEIMLGMSKGFGSNLVALYEVIFLALEGNPTMVDVL